MKYQNWSLDFSTVLNKSNLQMRRKCDSYILIIWKPVLLIFQNDIDRDIQNKTKLISFLKDFFALYRQHIIEFDRLETSYGLTIKDLKTHIERLLGNINNYVYMDSICKKNEISLIICVEIDGRKIIWTNE